MEKPKKRVLHYKVTRQNVSQAKRNGLKHTMVAKIQQCFIFYAQKRTMIS